ncbi:MAG: CHASE3 domain-containing protein, partial [Longimicrobiales bacterium]
MRLKTAEKVNAGFVIALAVVALIGIASITSIRRFASTTQDINATHDALTALQGVLLNLAAAEGAQRGYIITGDPAYLEPIDSLTSNSIRQIHALRENTYADPAQQHRLSLLASLVADRSRRVYEVARLRRDDGIAAAAARVEAGEGRAVMDSIQVLAGDFERIEMQRLASRSRTATLRARLATALIAGGGVLAFFVVLV